MAATLTLHIERLRRHHDSALRSYDDISLLDLSHALRMVADLRPQMAILAPKSASTIALRNATPPRPLIRKIGSHDFVYAAMPGGVLTYASGGELLSGSSDHLGTGDFDISARVKRRTDGGIEMQTLLLVIGKSEVESHTHQPSLTRANLDQWFDGEAVRGRLKVADGSTQEFRITREQLIRRVANTLDGSHPAGIPGAPADAKEIDAVVTRLLETRAGALPLPYLLLMKSAQDILKVSANWI